MPKAMILYLYNCIPLTYLSLGLLLFVVYQKPERWKLVVIAIATMILLQLVCLQDMYFGEVVTPKYVKVRIASKTESIFYETMGAEYRDIRFIRQFITAVKFSLRHLLFFYTWVILKDKLALKPILIGMTPILICFLLYLLSYWVHFIYYYNFDGLFGGCSWWILKFLPSILYSALSLYEAYRQCRKHRKLYCYEMFVALFILLTVALLEQEYNNVDGAMPLLDTCYMVFLILYYIFLYGRSMITKLHDSENALKLSQIRPHFIFNSLSSIIDLCPKDSEAQKSLLDFSNYLRTNIDVPDSKRLISFEKELDCIRHYVALEKLSYQDRLSVEYRIDEKDFCLPPLSVQPIVENSIKHGFKECKEINIVIKSYKSNEFYCVEVTDNGPGFEEKKINENSVHVGIKNIRYRLERLLNATLEYESTNNGTTALVKIPEIKSGENK